MCIDSNFFQLISDEYKSLIRSLDTRKNSEVTHTVKYPLLIPTIVGFLLEYPFVYCYSHYLLKNLSTSLLQISNCLSEVQLTLYKLVFSNEER